MGGDGIKCPSESLLEASHGLGTVGGYCQIQSRILFVEVLDEPDALVFVKLEAVGGEVAITKEASLWTTMGGNVSGPSWYCDSVFGTEIKVSNSLSQLG